MQSPQGKKAKYGNYLRSAKCQIVGCISRGQKGKTKGFLKGRGWQVGMKSGKNSKILDIEKYNFDFQKMGKKEFHKLLTSVSDVNPGPYF